MGNPIMVATSAPVLGNYRLEYVWNGKYYHKRSFKDLKEYYDFVESTPEGFQPKDSRKSNRNNWYGTPTFEKAMEYARGGWKKGLQEMEYYENISDMEYGNKQQKNIWDVENDVTGDFVDIESYIQGVPECMARFTEKREKKFADIFVKVDYNWMVREDQIRKRGIEILKMIDALEKNNIKTRVTGYVLARGWDGSHYITTVVFKDYHQPLELDYLVFPLSSVSFLRRLWFSQIEHEDIAFREGFQGRRLNHYGGCENLNMYPEELWKNEFDSTRLFVIDDPASSVYDANAIKEKVKEILKAS